MFQSFQLFVGQKVELDELLSNLTLFKYERVNKTSSVGEFALRGGILDLYPTGFDAPVRIDFNDIEITAIASINIDTGKSIWQHKIVIVLPNKQKKDVFNAEMPINNFIDIESGDYVVHNQHGIGRFLGVKDVEVNDKLKKHLVIEYDGGDKLFVPEHDMKLVQKYVSFQKRPPRLYKLGSQEWIKIRRQIQKKIQRLAGELLHVQSMRAAMQGFAFSKDTPWQQEFEKDFPFEDTPDQREATLKVKEDMESIRPMDRLLCGDVGYGKTEVAMRAAFKAMMDGRQVAILVPTTILAEQHYYNFKKRLKKFPVTVAMLSRFRSKAEQSVIIKDLKEGKVDLVIGTHRLLSGDISFHNLGLIIIDEEQRFGVKAKEHLKRFRLLADVLTLTATPIPRTLHMALTGARDMSIISTPPQNRIPVLTKICEFDEGLIQKAIQAELKRKGQVFFLHNRVEDIEQIAKIIKRLVPEAHLAVGHGQMPAKELEEIMLQFLDGQVNVLVCTTIIESGIDVPNANTLIVNRADHIGLADLHQLRGRVGRFDRQAYAYLIIPSRKMVSGDAKARLEAIEKYSGLGSGFKIAFEDLQLRGAGNLLGAQQSGFIASVGFDLYCRILKESVEQLKHTQKLPQGKNHEN